MRFEWDPAKDRTNRRKHGIAFAEAMTVFDDLRGVETVDIEHSDPVETRFELTGMTHNGHLLTVIFTERDGDDESSEEKIRIISARRADRKERAAYEARLYDHGGGDPPH